jgi:hypothetical protein
MADLIENAPESSTSDDIKLRFEETLGKARQFDIQPVVRRFMTKRNTSVERATEIADELLKYLTLCAVEPKEDWTMTGEVDEMWHTFILFTERYRKFCLEICGRFIDHNPAEEESPAIDVNEFIERIKPLQAANIKLPLALVQRVNNNLLNPRIVGANPSVCKPINETFKSSAGDSYSNTLKKFESLLGVAPKKNLWPSPSIFARPQTPEACMGGSGGGTGTQLCGCGPIKNGPDPANGPR